MDVVPIFNSLLGFPPTHPLTHFRDCLSHLLPLFLAGKILTMQKSLLTLILLTTLFTTRAQSVGIGTNTPNNSAILDLNSTSKGFLLPRLNNTQMFAIPNPAAGLVVFNTNYNQLYHYDGTTWRSVNNSSFWIKPLANRDLLSNATDSVGIGVSVPTRRLDVNGTMRVRGTLFADGAIDMSSAIISGSFLAGSGVVQGSLQTNNQLVVNNSSGILQFRDGSSNIGFVQLSGKDLRLGTNASNSDGKFVVRTAGTDRMSVDNEGVVNITNKITSTTTGDASLTPLCWGLTATAANGGLKRGTANIASVLRLERGHYRIYCPGITPESCAIFSNLATDISIGHICYNGFVDVFVVLSYSGEYYDQAFSFIIY